MIIYNYLNRISRNSAFASVAYKKFSSEMRCNLDQKCPKTAGQLQQLLMFASTSNVSVRKKHSWTDTRNYETGFSRFQISSQSCRVPGI